MLALISQGRFDEALPLCRQARRQCPTSSASRAWCWPSMPSARRTSPGAETWLKLALESDLDRLITGVMTGWAKTGAGDANGALASISTKLEGPDWYGLFIILPSRADRRPAGLTTRPTRSTGRDLTTPRPAVPRPRHGCAPRKPMRASSPARATRRTRSRARQGRRVRAGRCSCRAARQDQQGRQAIAPFVDGPSGRRLGDSARPRHRAQPRRRRSRSSGSICNMRWRSSPTATSCSGAARRRRRAAEGRRGRHRALSPHSRRLAAEASCPTCSSA